MVNPWGQDGGVGDLSSQKMLGLITFCIVVPLGPALHIEMFVCKNILVILTQPDELSLQMLHNVTIYNMIDYCYSSNQLVEECK